MRTTQRKMIITIIITTLILITIIAILLIVIIVTTTQWITVSPHRKEGRNPGLVCMFPVRLCGFFPGTVLRHARYVHWRAVAGGNRYACASECSVCSAVKCVPPLTQCMLGQAPAPLTALATKSQLDNGRTDERIIIFVFLPLPKLLHYPNPRLDTD